MPWKREKRLFSPLEIRDIKRYDSLEDKGIDGFLKVGYFPHIISLFIEIKNRTAPQVIEAGINSLLQLKKYEKYKDLVPEKAMR